MKPEIPIFFTVDNGYAPFLSVALHSAIDHASADRQYRAIVLHQGLSEDNIRKLKALERENFQITLTPMQSNFAALEDCMSNRLRCDYFTLTIYFRLFIPAMFPQYDKGIYLDSDIVLKADPAELFDTDLKEAYLGACRDISIAHVPPLVAYTEEMVGMKKNEYVNSGVLLMDLKKLREKDLEGNFLRLLNAYHFDTLAPDQDYLNAMCNGRILYLDEGWNTMPGEFSPATPKLIHYNLFSKPWCYKGIQYEEDFWHYAKRSDYYGQIYAHREAYSQEKKQADRQCMELLIRRSTEVPLQENTFRKLHEKGVKIRL